MASSLPRLIRKLKLNLYLLERVIDGRDKKRREKIVEMITTIGRVLAVVGSARAIDYADDIIINIFLFIQSVSKSTWGQVGITIIFGFVGRLFFLFKKYQQYWYGVIESGIALFGAYKFANELQKYKLESGIALVLILSFFTTIYVLVRGYSNIDEGKRKRYFLKFLLERKAVKVD